MHLFAVAEVNNDLDKFLKWYNSSLVEPNITSLGIYVWFALGVAGKVESTVSR